jgi:hypothetical protein
MIVKQFVPGELQEVENVLARSDFLVSVEDHVRRGGLRYMDSILTICDRRGLDPDSIVAMIRQNKEFKEKLFVEAVGLHMVGEDMRSRLR